MSRDLTWAATSVPEIRGRWCNALDAMADGQAEMIASPPEGGAAAGVAKRIERMQEKATAALEVMRSEAAALRGAELYWVARSMVDAAVGAAATLPAWTPALAMPSPTGMLCWARPAGTVTDGHLLPPVNEVSWDSIWWWSRPDGALQLHPASRNTAKAQAMFGVRSPLWTAHTIIVDPKKPRTDEVVGSPQGHRFVSVLGAAWLLMGQANISETSTFTDTSPPPRRRDPASTTSSTPRERQPVTVTLVDLRGARAAGKRSRGSDRRSQEERTWVAWPGGYWRQQAFGPGHSLRKPKWVGPYTKGPEGAPLAAPKPRVNVLRG